MANYANLQDAIDSGITNMTAKLNGVRNDGSPGTYPTGIDWFKFNGNVVSSIYVHGDSYVGLGSTSKNFYVNNRDGSVWYFYMESGRIGVVKFLKIRWVGHAYWNSANNPSGSDRLEWELFLLDTGQIFMNYYKVPTSYFTNSNGLSSNNSVSFSTSSGVAKELTFTPSDTVNGKNWSVSADRPDLSGTFASYGSAIYTFSNLSNIHDLYSSNISWIQDKPEDTEIVVSAKLDNGPYYVCESGSQLSCLSGISDISSSSITIKVELSTNNEFLTPSVSDIHITLKDHDDRKMFILNLSAPNIRGAVDNPIISYDGLGSLSGDGGPVESFEEEFELENITWAGNQNDIEHLEISINASGSMLAIAYSDYKSSDEHLEISMDAHGTLTDIRDI